jgi:hypothetical protein
VDAVLRSAYAIVARGALRAIVGAADVAVRDERRDWFVARSPDPTPRRPASLAEDVGNVEELRNLVDRLDT